VRWTDPRRRLAGKVAGPVVDAAVVVIHHDPSAPLV
jgi:hypothetical protein